jgi:hypothetical protein
VHSTTAVLQIEQGATWITTDASLSSVVAHVAWLALDDVVTWTLIEASSLSVDSVTFLIDGSDSCVMPLLNYTLTASQLSVTFSTASNGNLNCPCGTGCAQGLICGDVSNVCIVSTQMSCSEALLVFFSLILA